MRGSLSTSHGRTATPHLQAARHIDLTEVAHRATDRAVAVLGALVGAAGIEHGIGEVLQGPVPPDGVLIMSWPDAAALEILSGEPAMTVVGDMRVTGVLAIVVGVMVAVWSVGFATRRHGGAALIGLSVLLLLVGGGLAPPVMGIVLGAVATRAGASPHRPPGPLLRRVAPAWPWFLATAVIGYLGLMPGMLLAHAWGAATETLVIVLATVAFTGFGLSLTAARAHDRSQTIERSRT